MRKQRSPVPLEEGGMNPNVYLGFSLILLTGCADNPYAKTYQPSSAMVLQSVAQRREQPGRNTPVLVKGTDPRKDWAALCTEGYVVIGRSKLRGGSTGSDADAIAQAKAVGADRVLLYRESDSFGREAGYGQRSVANGATAFAPNGAAMIAGSATETTFGAGPTGNAPATILAVFLVKESRAFGATCSSPGPS